MGPERNGKLCHSLEGIYGLQEWEISIIKKEFPLEVATHMPADEIRIGDLLLDSDSEAIGCVTATSLPDGSPGKSLHLDNGTFICAADDDFFTVFRGLEGVREEVCIHVSYSEQAGGWIVCDDCGADVTLEIM